MIDRPRIKALAAAWRRLGTEPDLVLPLVDDAEAKLNKINNELGAYMDGGHNRNTEIARRLVAGEMSMGDAIVAQIVSADTEGARKAATNINRTAIAVVVEQTQAALMQNGGRIHRLLTDEYAGIMARTREVAPLVDGITDGAQALHAPTEQRTAWIELVDMAERRQAIREAHSACRGAGIWGQVPSKVYPFPDWAFEYPTPDDRPHGYGGLVPELKLVVDATVRGARLFNNAQAGHNVDLWVKNLPPEPEFVIGEVDLDRRPSTVG